MKYNGLIQQIDSDVNTNGQNRITGAKLNAVLNGMVSVLGDGFRIAGQIYPDSEAPTDPENGLCYIAKAAGTYTDFGYATVNNDEIALIYYDSDNERWGKMGWDRKDFGLVVVDASTSAAFGEDEMKEVRKPICFIIRNDFDGVINRFFVKDRSENGYFWFYAAPMLSSDLAGDLILKQCYLQVSATINDGRYPYVSRKTEEKLPTKGNVEYALSLKQDKLTFDTTPTTGSTNPITSGGVKNAISGFIDNTVSNLVNYYTKSETYTKTEVTDLIAAIHAARFEVVQSLPVRGETNVIYLLPASSPTTGNVYNEYVWVNNAWELIGSTSLDLSNYYTKTQTDNLLLGKQNTLTFDTTPTAGSTNPVTSGGIKNYVDSHGGGAGMDVVELSSMTGTMTSEQAALVASDHCIVKHDGDYYYKDTGTQYRKIGEDKTNTEVTGHVMNFNGTFYYFTNDSYSYTTVDPYTTDVPTAQLEKVMIGYETFSIPQGTYSLPSGGIPASDLASAVQTSLGKADTALQSYTETDPVFSASAAAGITAGDISDWNGKAEPTPVVDASTIPSSMEPNKLYKYGTLSGNTVFPPFATPTDQTIANVYWWKFTTPSTAPNITWPAGITEWAGGQAPNIDASTTYEITVEDGLASYIKS